MKILTWIKPTGDWMHLWNYFGMFKPLIELSKQKESFLMIADLHSLTSVHNWDILRKNKERMLLEFFSLFSSGEDLIVFEQSKSGFHNDISWALSSVTPYSLMLRAHSFKDAKAKNSDINMATFNYPILMAADILAYDIDIVPVWKDQKQHLEFARDIAENFNKTYDRDFFKLPEVLVKKDVWVIPWTDWRKMSKSYDNFLWIFDDEKTLKKRIMSIVTDDKSLEDPKDPDNCNIFSLIKLLASKERQKEIKKKYLAWWYGYWHAKLELLDIFLEYFKEPRGRFEKLKANQTDIYLKLETWNNYVRELSSRKYQELKSLVWLT